jgi:hypothetical protein
VPTGQTGHCTTDGHCPGGEGGGGRVQDVVVQRVASPQSIRQMYPTGQIGHCASGQFNCFF